MRRFHRLEAALEHVPMQPGWSDKMITLTPQWNDDVPEAYSVEGLRRRKEVYFKAFKGTARWLAQKYPGCSVWVAVEFAHGFIHAHLHIRGPFVPFALLRADFESRLQPVYVGDVLVATGEGGARIERCRSLREVTKYNTKSGSPHDEDFMAGERRVCTNPVLVARWQMVTHGARLTEAYGSLRSAWKAEGEEDEDEAKEKAADKWRTEVDDAEEAAKLEEEAGVAAVTADEPPCSCGKHDWKWHVVPLVRWIRGCHRQGLPALYGSRWIPPPEVRWGSRGG